ncbi:flavodoxin family protein [Fibrobacter sp.]|uniref:flavodoxin family protein n=1 Tax=Fibrobacter sp. TaxID=35828 RepID=UPI00388EE44D
MNILIINGSPKKSGLTSQMLEVMREEAANNGAIVDVVHANDLTIKPCLGCMACRKTGKCVLPEDDSIRLLEKIKSADAVIIGAPCYWGNIPGQLKLAFDRMVYGMMRETDRFPEPLMPGKKCILLSTCTTPWPFNILMNQSRGAIKALREICRYSGFKIVSTVERGGTQKHPKLSEQDYTHCVKAARKLKD